MRAWGAASGDFERRLARQESPAVIDLHIEGETRRGHDFVRVYVVMTVVAPDVGQALVTAWRVFRKAAGDDIAGWDVAAARAEVRPAARAGEVGSSRTTAAVRSAWAPVSASGGGDWGAGVVPVQAHRGRVIRIHHRPGHAVGGDPADQVMGRAVPVERRQR